jgi:hypothetical protein
MIKILGMKVSKKCSCRARKVRLLLCHNYGVKIGISRPLAKSEQAENNHEILQEFNTQVMEKMDGKAERGWICESDSTIMMVDHYNCCRGVVTVCGAEAWQHVKISHRILIQAPNKVIK